jgi:uncharacterized protein (UPF0335 family)
MSTLNNKQLSDAFNEIMREEENKGTIADSIKAIYLKLKSDGHDVDALKKIVSDQKKEMKKVLQTEEMVDIYRDALGIVNNKSGE